MWIWSSLRLWMSWPRKVPGHPQASCWSPSWILFWQGFNIHMYSGKHSRSSFRNPHCTCGYSCPVSHSPTQCWSCRGFRFHVYLVKHCISCFMHMNLVFILPVDALSPWGLSHPHSQSWLHHFILFCQWFNIHSTLINIVIPISCLCIWSSLYLWMSSSHMCPAIHRHSDDHAPG